MMTGKIIRGVGGFYYIHPESAEKDMLVECKAKGIFRNRNIKPLVGDNVEFEMLDEEKKLGNIQEILPRKNALIRPASANVDQAVVVFALSFPETQPEFAGSISVNDADTGYSGNHLL